MVNGYFKKNLMLNLILDVHLKFRQNLKNVVPIILLVVTLLLILRGLNFRLVYFDPKIETENN